MEGIESFGDEVTGGAKALQHLLAGQHRVLAGGIGDGPMEPAGLAALLDVSQLAGDAVEQIEKTIPPVVGVVNDAMSTVESSPATVFANCAACLPR